MAGLFRKLYQWLLGLFWSTELDITIVGLQNAGKTSLLRLLAGDGYNDDSIPTIGFNLREVRQGKVTLKCWDVGGQPRFRTMWERYCQDANAIVFVVDAADHAAFPVARDELTYLLNKITLANIPLLVLANKSDILEAASAEDVIEALELSKITNRTASCYRISVKEETNLKAVVDWLIKNGKQAH